MLEVHTAHRHLMITAGRLRTKLYTSGRAAAILRYQLFVGVSLCVNTSRIVTRHLTILNQHIFKRHKDACAVRTLHDKTIVCQGVEHAVSHGYILAAVHIKGVAVCVDQNAIDIHIFNTLCDDRKVTADDE